MVIKAGFEMVTANDGEEGIKLFREHQFDLVITDIIMPVMEGIETILQLRKINPGVKIIAMSGGGQVRADNYLNTATALKVNAVLKKPFSYEELLTALSSTLQLPE